MAVPTPIGVLADTWARRVEDARRKAARHGPFPASKPAARPSMEEAAAAERRWEVRIPARYRHARVSDLTGDLADASTWDGVSDVLLLGNVGAGKTHAAVALARTAHEAGREVLFRPALALVEDLKPDGDPQAMDRAVKADVLVLDDLGTERRTDFAADRISLLLVSRYDDCRPTIVTSNLGPDDLEPQVGERIWSRLFHDALRIKTAGPDRRRTS